LSSTFGAESAGGQGHCEGIVSPVERDDGDDVVFLGELVGLGGDLRGGKPAWLRDAIETEELAGEGTGFRGPSTAPGKIKLHGAECVKKREPFGERER
jgi:hypothetical protein